VAGRLLLALTNLSDTLKHDHQLSSPLTSYLNCGPPHRHHSLALIQTQYRRVFTCSKMGLTHILEAFSDRYVAEVTYVSLPVDN
jgi:hypothetical protein